MADSLKPRDAKEVEQAIQWALGNGKTFELIGHGSKRAIGRAAQWDATLDLSELSGVTLYEPEELVLSAKAGTPIAEIEALVAASKQELAFEPIDYAVVLGGPAAAGTIGGVIAANLSGPRRIKAGAARDHFLGFAAVSGRGETFKSGGRVVKNVTGYDLCKLLAGSWGTLAAMTEVTVKTLPRAETEETVLVLNLDDGTARKVMTASMGSFADVSGGCPSAGCRGGADRRDCERGRSCHRIPSRGRRALGRAAQELAANTAFAVRRARHAGRSALADLVAGDPRRSAVRGEWSCRYARPLAYLNGAEPRSRSRARALRTDGRRDYL